MMLGTVSEIGDHVGVGGIDVDRDPNDDDAVVIGPGQGRGDRDRGSGAPLKGPARYILPTAWKGWVPGPAATLVVPICEVGGQLGAACSARPRFWAAAGDRRLRAVGDPAQGRRSGPGAS